MESKQEIYHLWVQYTTKNEEIYFRKFIKGFVAIWESQLNLDWSRPPEWKTIKHDTGPHLSRLPEELLPALGKFIYIAKEQTEKNLLDDEALEQLNLLVRCLIIICRNFDNIPFIASCDYVSHLIGITATIIHQIIESSSTNSSNSELTINLCHLLEVLYDPYFTSRHIALGQRIDRGKLPLQPALLHVEVIPFIYDCFQIPIVEKLPNLTCELLNVLGAIISGTKHNALRAICPATVNIVLGVISHQQVITTIASLASHCFILMVQFLNKSSADQRQIEVITLVQQLCEVCGEVSQSGSANSAQWCAITFKKLLIISEIDSRLWEIVRDQRALDVIIVLLESAKRFPFKESQNVACECISTMSLLLKNDPQIQNRMERHIGYERLLQALRRLGEPSESLLKNLIVFAGPPDIQNPQAILLLVRWLVELPDIELQSWLTNELYTLCTGTHASRTRACRAHVALHACHALERHTRLGEHSSKELIRLVESLAHHSITPQELKHILLLLREEPGQDTFPYRIHLLHALSAIARKTSSPLSPTATPGLNHECLCYFDIQDDKDGLFVPDISKWPGASYGFSFHCWVRFDHIKENKNQGFRRQLFNVSTSSGVGLEAFLRSDGALTVGISTKKEYLAAVATPPTTSSGSILGDGRWHAVSICHQAARRPFGQNHLFIYIDGVQRIQAAIKSPAMTDAFANCVIGGIAPTPPPQNFRTQTSLPGPQGLLPSIIQQVPSYLTLPLRSAPLDPSVKAFPAGMQDVLWGNQISMRGQLAFVALFHESLSTNQVKSLYEAGPSCAINLANDESSNDQVSDLTDLTNKLVFCYSPMAASEGRCLDLAPQHKFTASYRGSLIKLQSIKESLVAVGGIHALFPILEAACRGLGADDPDLSLVSPSVAKEASIMEGNENKADRDDWEILPSSSYSDWKLEQNPISGFLSLIKNLTSKAPLHQEQLVRSQGLQVIGLLLSKAKAHLIDVNVLMAVQLLAESARDVGNQHLLRALYQHLLFNFSIWSHGPFHIRVGHAQYLATVIKDERRVLRRRYGVQYLLDVIKRHCARPDGISEDDVKTVRMSLIGLVKFYVQREVSAKEVRAIIGYILVTTRDEPLASEATDLIASCLEVRQSSRDQLHLLLMEPGVIDLLYLLVVDPSTNIELKQKILRVFSILLRSDRIYDRSKARLRLQLQEGDCYSGLVTLLSNQTFTSDFLGLLMDQILMTDSACAYSGALALLYSLSNAEMNLKLEAARKLLIVTFMRPSAAQLIAKQTGWQDCITRLLVKRPIQSDDNLLPDLMSFEEDLANSSLPSNNDSSAASVAAAAASAALAAVPGGSFVTDAAVALGDEVKEAAGNLSSAVANAYSALRQKTVEMQESLEELGESAVSKLKTRRSLISIYEGNENIAPGSPRPFRAPTELLATLGLDVDSVSLAERSSSSSTSTEELSASSHGPAATTASASDATSLASHESGAGDDNTLPHWRSLEGDPRADETEELCSVVANLLFTVLWRGMDGSDGDTWRRRGQVLAAVNLLGLNNELHCSHLELKLRLLEMGAQAALSDLRDASQSQSLVQAENAAHLLRWIYDLVVLDPATNLRPPRVSTKLLDAVLGLLDTLLVFQDGLDEWTELARVGLGVLLACAGHEDLELCAMATAKLHALVQTRPANTEEASYLLGRLDHSLQRALQQGRDEQYAFLMPVVKALLDRLQTPLHLSSHLPDLARLRAGPAFFEDFRAFCQTPPWRDFVLKKVTPLQEAYEAQVQAQLGVSLDTFWAECYEACKLASQRRLRECAEARHRLQVHILGPARQRQCEEAARFAAVGAQERVEEAAAQRRWRKLKHELTGPRGAWQARDDSWKQYWRRSHHENHSRMRLKLNLTLEYNSHTDASNLRDNTGWLSRVQSADGMPLPGLAKAAANQGDPEDEFPFIEDEMRSIPSESTTNQPHSDTREKLILAQDCELVTLMSAIKGRFELTNTHFYFHEIPSSSSSSSTERHDFVWPLNRLREVHLRRYNLRRSALEIFLTNQQNYFLNFTTKTRAKVLSRLASLRPPNLIFTSSRSPAELLRASGLTQKWVHREISNFDYLMHLNTLAGRTYNDLSQYPVCPWILADYSSDHLDLDNPNTFRDLSKPIGVVNPKNEAEVRAKFDNFEDPSGTIAKFHYGTHYSNSAGVLHYLVRLEPYTSLHIELQSGRFDVADRQFHSVAQTWRLLMDNPNDVKELTPEFFYMPEFLKNHNKFDLGLLQGTRDRVDDVILPPWAKNAEDFIEQHRRALESEYVSSQLHHWIDLIFGYKQKGVGAVDALNVFYYCSYEGAVDLDSIEDAIEREAVEGMINNFGQTPSQLLREAHPRRLSRMEVLAKITKGDYPRPDLTQYLDLITHNLFEVTSDKDPVIFVSVTRTADRRGESLVTITRNGFVTVNPWPEINVSAANKSRRGASVISSWHPSLVSRPPSSAFAVSADGRFLLTGGHWDYSLRVHSLAKGRTVHIARRHHDLIICVSADPCGWYLATGSRDLTIVIWDASTLGVSSPRPLRTFHGHQAPITCIALSAELDVLVSGSEDGTVNVYGLESGELCHILQPHGLSSSGPTRVTHVSLSYHGYISFAAAHEHSTGAQHTINVFTLNGTSLGAKLVAARVTSLVAIGERLAVVDDAGDLTISTLHGLHPAHNEPCHVPAHYVAAAPGNAALVIALGDGSLAILAVKQPSKSGGAI